MNRIFAAVSLLLLLVVSCNSSGVDTPVFSSPESVQDTTRSVKMGGPNRNLVGMWHVHVAEDHRNIDVVPVRGLEFHLNATKMLEAGYCADCLEISNLFSPAPGELALDLTVKHPFTDDFPLKYTCFDPRAIFITKGDFEFPEMGKLISFSGEHPRLLNPDGYTQLFNPSEFPESGSEPPYLKYYTGKFSLGGDFNATLNPYIAYSKDEPRRMFTPGSSETLPVHIAVPFGAFEFGYAIDISWIFMDGPVTDPQMDFPPEANCLEPYQLSVNLDYPLTTYPGGSSQISVRLKDWQLQASLDAVTIEIPEISEEIFQLTMEYFNPDTGFVYTGEITNSLNAEAGSYPALIRANETSDDINLGGIDAWLVTTIDVEFFDDELISIIPDIGTVSMTLEDVVITGCCFDTPVTEVRFELEGNYSFAADDLVIQNESSIECSIEIPLDAEPGIYDVIVIKEPGLGISGVTFEIEEFVPEISNITPDYLNFMPQDVEVSGNYLYVASCDHGLHIFDLTDPSQPQWINRGMKNEDLREVRVYGDYAFTANADIGLADAGFAITDISDPNNTFVEASFNILDRVYTVCAGDGYAYVGSGTSTWPPDEWGELNIYDIDPMDEVHLVGTLETVKIVKYVEYYDGYVLMSLHGTDIKVVDVSNPEAPEITGSIDCSISPWRFCIRDHFLYVIGHSQTTLEIIDISDPLNSEIINTLTLSDDIAGYFCGICVNENYAYIIDRIEGLHIIDINLPETMSYVSTIPLDCSNKYIAISETHAYCGSEGAGIETIDISNPGNEFYTGLTPSPGNAWDVAVSDGLAWVIATGGPMMLMDIDPPEETHVIQIHENYYPCGGGERIQADGNMCYVLRDTFLDILEYGQSGEISLVHSFDFETDDIWEIKYDAGYIYAALGFSPGGLMIVDVDPPESAAVINLVEGHVIRSIEIVDGYAFVANSTTFQGLKIIDIDPPESAEVIKTIFTDDPMAYCSYSAGYLFESGSISYVFDVDPPEETYLKHEFSAEGRCSDADGGIFVTTGYDRTYFYDISPPSEFNLLKMEMFPSGAGLDVECDNGYAYIADLTGIRIYKLWN